MLSMSRTIPHSVSECPFIFRLQYWYPCFTLHLSMFSCLSFTVIWWQFQVVAVVWNAAGLHSLLIWRKKWATLHYPPVVLWMNLIVIRDVVHKIMVFVFQILCWYECYSYDNTLGLLFQELLVLGGRFTRRFLRIPFQVDVVHHTTQFTYTCRPIGSLRTFYYRTFQTVGYWLRNLHPIMIFVLSYSRNPISNKCQFRWL